MCARTGSRILRAFSGSRSASSSIDLLPFAFERRRRGQNSLGEMFRRVHLGRSGRRHRDAPEGATRSPHSRQNFADGGNSVPQFEPRTTRRAPHSRQNFACAGVLVPTRRALHQSSSRSSLESLPLRRLSFQEECLRKLTLTTDLERSEVLVPGTGRRLRLGFTPQLQLVEILGGDLTLGDAIKEMLAETRWKIGPPNLWHQPPNVMRASSSFKLSRSGGPGDSGTRLPGAKNRSFSAPFDCS